MMNSSEKKQNIKKVNFQQILDKILENSANSTDFSQENKENHTNLLQKQKLLLHACCGPCSSYVLEYLEKYFQITVFYYNPNIYPLQEYQRRFEELKNFYKIFPPALKGKIQIAEKEYNPQEFYNAIKINSEPQLANEPEKGERCYRCYKFRLKAAFDYAFQNQFDYFCTTLSVSPFKDAQKINEIGENLQKDAENQLNLQKNAAKDGESFQSEFLKVPKWLPSDFKKKDGFKRSLQISEEYSLYRQDYCGCIYSKNTKNMIK